MTKHFRLIALLLFGCHQKPAPAVEVSLSLPAGFHATVFAKDVGPARHLVTRANGDVYVSLARPYQGHTLVALRDNNQDGQAEQIEYFGSGPGGTGIAMDQNWLYFSDHSQVFRQALPNGTQLIPTAQPETLVTNLGGETEHNARTLALNGNQLYVNVGSPSNSCQTFNRFPFLPGQNPCPQLKEHAGIWRFAADKLNQDKTIDGLHFATGVRNAVALDWNPWTNKLYIAQHGRDMLHEGFWQHYSFEQGMNLPAEEFTDLEAGDNLGWPYCYYDPMLKKRILAPEYGGNGQESKGCEAYKQPLVSLPAHAAPNDLLFYSGSLFPPKYQQGAFIALHGSSHQTKQQRGYQVVFIPFIKGQPSDWEFFADGFAAPDPPPTPSSAFYRPMGLAQLPDGSLLIADSKHGRIWKIAYAAP